MIVFMSDNGLLWGEHRWQSKMVPYEESVRVPMVVRYDPLTAVTRRDDHPVVNIDLAPTFAALAGTTAPGAEGRSLLPLLLDPGARWRSDFLLEHWGGLVPGYCGVHTDRWVYVKYATGEEELYDLWTDPNQLVNVAADPAHRPLLAALRARLIRLCRPPPPGVVP